MNNFDENEKKAFKIASFSVGICALIVVFTFIGTLGEIDKQNLFNIPIFVELTIFGNIVPWTMIVKNIKIFNHLKQSLKNVTSQEMVECIV